MGWRRAELLLQRIDTEGALKEPWCAWLQLETEGEEDGVWHVSLLAATTLLLCSRRAGGMKAHLENEELG